MTENWDIIQPYEGKSVYIKIEGYIDNPQNRLRAPFSIIKTMVDTGYTSGVFSEATLISDAEMIGVKPVLTKIKLGDGSKVPCHVCAAYIEKLNNISIPPPGKRITLYMRGRESHCIGMEALSTWILRFDGPKSTLFIKV